MTSDALLSENFFNFITKEKNRVEPSWNKIFNMLIAMFSNVKRLQQILPPDKN